MSTNGALAVVHTGEIVVAEEWTDTRKEFIRKAFCGGADDVTAATFLALCERRRLSPEARHVYLVNRAKKGAPPNWVIQTGIDGYRLIADRTGRYAGSDDPVFEYDPEGRPVRATVTVRKLVSGITGSFTASARWDEYAAGSQMWDKMPHTMLAKCAEALALRKAFPEELSGMYTDAEMDQAETPAVSARVQEPVRVVPSSAPQPAAIESGDRPTGQANGNPATDRQINFIKALAKDLGMKIQGPDGDYHTDETALAAIVGVDFESDWPKIDRQTASAIIESFQSEIKAKQQQGELIPSVRDHTA